MSSANLLPPSAPPAENERRIYPSLPEMTNAENFRLTEISRMNELPVIGYPCLREELWDRQGANIASR